VWWSFPKALLKFGIQIRNFPKANGEEEEEEGGGGRRKATVYDYCERITTQAEELGFDSVWVVDHVEMVPPISNEIQENPEAWITLAALARSTRRVRLGTLVTCSIYRNPALIAKMSATLDNISYGRLNFGIGAGWFETECKAFGFDFPGTQDRLGMLQESVQIIPKLWEGKRTTFHGKYYNVEDAICLPRPLQRPRPPIWIGGSGEKKTLKLVAQYADACNLFGDLVSIKRKLNVLKEYCKECNRDFENIIKSKHNNVIIGTSAEEITRKFKKFVGENTDFAKFVSSNIIGRPEDCANKINSYIEAGIDYFTLNFPDASNPKTLDMFMENVISQFVVA
jgi:F420-dependent oxidoreductase-like protein